MVEFSWSELPSVVDTVDPAPGHATSAALGALTHFANSSKTGDSD